MIAFKVYLCKSDEIASLEAAIAELQQQLRVMSAELERVGLRYRQEANHAMALEDILREHGIAWR